jgi:putative hydrolase of the HAD superfamily
MFKVILFDIDGVLIRLPHYHSEVLQENGYKNAVKILDEFYSGEKNKLCNTAKKDPLYTIKPYLNKLGMDKTPEDFFLEQYDFEKNYLDLNLISKIQIIRNKDIKCFLATDQNFHRIDYLLNILKFKNYFDGYFVSCKIGYCKIDIEYWEIILKKLRLLVPGLNNSEILYLDDMEKNIENAKRFDIITSLIINEADIYESLKTLL